jgi:hypothetical protein
VVKRIKIRSSSLPNRKCWIDYTSGENCTVYRVDERMVEILQANGRIRHRQKGKVVGWKSSSRRALALKLIIDINKNNRY